MKASVLASWVLPLLSMSVVTGCGGTDPTPTASKWYFTCGDPVCRGYTAPAGVPKCTTEKAGDSCVTGAAECDPVDSCNRRLRCATSDPTMQPGGCPISRRSVKTDIQYLSATDLQRYADEVMKMKLATFKYRAGGPQRLGFMIDDQGDGTGKSMSVDAERDMVDLYGFTSMAVATLKVQQQQIQGLEQKLSELSSQLRTCQPTSSARTRSSSR